MRENKALEKLADSEKWKLHLLFEYTASNTPQHNHLAELAFVTLRNRGRAMMAAVNLPSTVKAKLFKEAFVTATVLDGLATVELDGVTKSRYEWFHGNAPKFAEKLRTWGEAKSTMGWI